MPYRFEFDPELVAIMGCALDAAWAEFDAKSWVRTQPEKASIRRAFALSIMTAARLGQRDPQRLRRVALNVVEGAQNTPAANWQAPSGRASGTPQL
jgi:hypothetical protein